VLKVFGVDPAIAAAYTLVLHAALWLPITLLGLIYMAYESLSWQDLDQAIEASQHDRAEEVDPASIQMPADLSKEGEVHSLRS
jgi:hypothetical protein